MAYLLTAGFNVRNFSLKLSRNFYNFCFLAFILLKILNVAYFLSKVHCTFNKLENGHDLSLKFQTITHFPYLTERYMYFYGQQNF